MLMRLAFNSLKTAKTDPEPKVIKTLVNQRDLKTKDVVPRSRFTVFSGFIETFSSYSQGGDVCSGLSFMVLRN